MFSGKNLDPTAQEKVNQSIQIYKNKFLRMKNGFFGPSIYRGDSKLNTVVVKNVYKDNPEALLLYNNGRSTNTIGNLIGLASGYIVGSQFAQALSPDRKADRGLFIMGGIGSLASIILNVNGLRNIEKSTRVYNNSINALDEVSLKFRSTQNGLGLVLSF